MKKAITFIILMISLIHAGYAQPANYYMNPSFGADGTFNLDTPVSGIVNKEIQAVSTNNTFTISWDYDFNEWYNTAIDFNEVFTLTI